MESFPFPIVNKTPELADCRDSWFFDETYQVWCLEDILYTFKAATPKFQRMSIFVPKPYMSAPGVIDANGAMGKFTSATAPVVFENNSAGYMQMPHTWLGGPRDAAGQYLRRGMVYVTCGCRGRESRDQDGNLCGKSPWALVDLKTGIRFLRHNAASIPGDLNRIISVGWSAAGAMSALISVTGNSPLYDPYLKANGAFMDEKDDVYAAQIYCPITDLDHADLAYEWQFQNDPENEASPAGPAGVMSPFQTALSKKLAAAYVEYFNRLCLKDPVTGEMLTFHEDGRCGSAYDYLMARLEDSATDFLTRLAGGKLPEPYSVEDYITGNYTRKIPAPHAPHGPGGPEGAPRPSLGDLVSRPPKGAAYKPFEPPMLDAPGTDKRGWLRWDGKRASISSLDDYVLNHRRRMKPCTSFDTLNMSSGENQEFGSPERDYMHYNIHIAPAISALKEQFPEEYAKYYTAFAAADGDEELAMRRYLINPMHFIGGAQPCDAAGHYRIRVGGCDPDTAFTVSMTLALKLAEAGKDVDYALVWDMPHSPADYPGEVCDWIEAICADK